MVDNFELLNTLKLKKDSYKCVGFEWKGCEKSPLDVLDDSNCAIIEELVLIESKPVRIELDDSLLDRFNELSEDELIDYFGTFAPAESLNPYMTRFSMCSIEQARLEQLYIISGDVSAEGTSPIRLYLIV